jgi:bifunctional non-homologous end joining protein LigD
MKDAACQLLTALDDGEAAAAKLLDENYAAQQKFDGKRILLTVDRSSITAHNRSGLVCEISRNILDQARQLQAIAPLILDGEWLNQTKAFHAFDLLEVDGTDIKPLFFSQRQDQLNRILAVANLPGINSVRTEYHQAGKVQLLQTIHDHNLEGVVLKAKNSPYKVGRQPDQFKFKFTAVSSFVITGRNQKESVSLGAFDENNHLINCGDVKIRNRYFKVNEGMIIDVRYMHAFPSHLIYQPRMVAIRDDLQPEACTLSQLRYKGTRITVA